MPHCKVCKDLDLGSEALRYVDFDVPFTELESSARGGTCSSCCLLFDAIANFKDLAFGKEVDAVRLSPLESLAVQLRLGGGGLSDLFYLHVLPGRETSLACFLPGRSSFADSHSDSISKASHRHGPVSMKCPEFRGILRRMSRSLGPESSSKIVPSITSHV